MSKKLGDIIYNLRLKLEDLNNENRIAVVNLGSTSSLSNSIATSVERSGNEIFETINNFLNKRMSGLDSVKMDNDSIELKNSEKDNNAFGELS